MLQSILDSKPQSQVLSFFLVAPQRAFSIPELAKRLGMPTHKVSHALKLLADEHIILSFSKRGKKLYIVNARYGLLSLLKTSAQKDGLSYSDELLSAIKKLGDLDAAFLSGIFTGYPNLPVDLLLVGKVNLNKLSKFLKGAHRLMGQEINYSIMTPDEFLLRRDTFDKFIKDIFDYRHIVVKDDLKKKKS